MNKKQWIAGVVGIGIVGLLGWLAWQSQSTGVAPTDRVTVAATIFPLANLVEQVGGEHINVVLLIPVGVTEHSNALTPQKLQAAAPARAIFQIGHNLDTRLTERVKTVVPQAKVVTVDRGITLRNFDETTTIGEEHDHDHEDRVEEEDEHHDIGIDPHYWLTVPNAIQIAQTIRDELQIIDPAHQDDYAKNFERLQADLQKLEMELQQTAQGITPKQFMAMHNAWSYLADQYGLELVGTYEPIEGQEPSVQDLQRLQELAQHYGLKTFYAEPQKASSSITRFMEQELGLRVMILDPVGGTDSLNSYQALMEYNLGTLAQGTH